MVLATAETASSFLNSQAANNENRKEYYTCKFKS